MEEVTSGHTTFAEAENYSRDKFELKHFLRNNAASGGMVMLECVQFHRTFNASNLLSSTTYGCLKDKNGHRFSEWQSCEDVW